MLFEVPIEVGLLTEAPLAEGTLEGSFFVVDVPHVALQVAGYAEGTFTVLALVRLFAGVSAQVPRQVG